MDFAHDEDPVSLDRTEAPAALTADDLLELIAKHTPAWHADALCREYPEISWFPERGEPVRPAREICGRCLVAGECRAAGASEIYGIWGGLTINQRKGRRNR